jgi:hypothetical protein
MVQEKELDGTYKESNCVDWGADINISLIHILQLK